VSDYTSIYIDQSVCHFWVMDSTSVDSIGAYIPDCIVPSSNLYIQSGSIISVAGDRAIQLGPGGSLDADVILDSTSTIEWVAKYSNGIESWCDNQWHSFCLFINGITAVLNVDGVIHDSTGYVTPLYNLLINSDATTTTIIAIRISSGHRTSSFLGKIDRIDNNFYLPVVQVDFAEADTILSVNEHGIVETYRDSTYFISAYDIVFEDASILLYIPDYIDSTTFIPVPEYYDSTYYLIIPEYCDSTYYFELGHAFYDIDTFLRIPDHVDANIFLPTPEFIDANYQYHSLDHYYVDSTTFIPVPAFIETNTHIAAEYATYYNGEYRIKNIDENSTDANFIHAVIAEPIVSGLYTKFLDATNYDVSFDITISVLSCEDSNTLILTNNDSAEDSISSIYIANDAKVEANFYLNACYGDDVTADIYHHIYDETDISNEFRICIDGDPSATQIIFVGSSDIDYLDYNTSTHIAIPYIDHNYYINTLVPEWLDATTYLFNVIGEHCDNNFFFWTHPLDHAETNFYYHQPPATIYVDGNFYYNYDWGTLYKETNIYLNTDWNYEDASFHLKYEWGEVYVEARTYMNLWYPVVDVHYIIPVASIYKDYHFRIPLDDGVRYFDNNFAVYIVDPYKDSEFRIRIIVRNYSDWTYRFKQVDNVISAPFRIPIGKPYYYFDSWYYIKVPPKLEYVEAWFIVALGERGTPWFPGVPGGGPIGHPDDMSGSGLKKRRGDQLDPTGSKVRRIPGDDLDAGGGGGLDDEVITVNAQKLWVTKRALRHCLQMLVNNYLTALNIQKSDQIISRSGLPYKFINRIRELDRSWKLYKERFYSVATDIEKRSVFSVTQSYIHNTRSLFEDGVYPTLEDYDRVKGYNPSAGFRLYPGGVSLGKDKMVIVGGQQESQSNYIVGGQSDNKEWDKIDYVDGTAVSLSMDRRLNDNFVDRMRREFRDLIEDLDNEDILTAATYACYEFDEFVEWCRESHFRIEQGVQDIQSNNYEEFYPEFIDIMDDSIG